MSYIARRINNFFEFFGGMAIILANSIRLLSKGETYWKLLAEQMFLLGVNTIPIAVLTNSFLGAAITMILAPEFKKHGGEAFIGGMLALSYIREFTPVLIGIVFAGRVGSSITSQIGAMKTTEQIDALRSLRVDPDSYLTLPRLLGILLMIPMIAIISGCASFYASYLVAHYTIHISWPLWMTYLPDWIMMKDYFAGLIKVMTFGLVIALIAVERGYRVRHGAQDVGRAVTSSVVYSILAVFILDLFFASILRR